MLTLIRKDLLLHKTAFYGYIPVFVIYLAYLAGQVSSLNVFITFTCIMAAILPMVLITREDKFGAEAFVCSLPVTRHQVVHAKYVMCWCTALILVVIGLILYSIFAAERHAVIWSVSTASRVLLTLSVGLGVALPLSLRFGWVGLIAVLVGIQILGIVTLLLVRTFATNLRLGDAFNGIWGLIESIHSQLGGLLFFAAATVMFTIFNLASCNLAVALFERRDL